MAGVKTTRNDASVAKFLEAAAGDRLADCKAIGAMMKRVTGTAPKMWGTAIVGYGSWKHTSGKVTNEWPVAGYSPRKGTLVVYIEPSCFGKYAGLMKRLGKYGNGKSCLYFKRLSDVDPALLEELIEKSVAEVRRKYPS
jgi:hypothetical protein